MLVLMRRISVLLAALAFLLVMNSNGRLSAQTAEPTCESPTAATAITKVPLGKYDIFVKLGSQVTSTETTSLAINSLTQETGLCNEVGSVNASSASYSPIARDYEVLDEAVEIFLSSPNTASAQTAGGPQIVFVPTNTEICDFSKGCVVEYQGQQMELSPKKISLTSDSLKVGLLQFDNTEVRTVIYSVDSKPAYESKELKPFNEWYVPGGEHTLSRRVVFKDGVSLSDTATIKHGTVANAKYIFQSAVARHSISLIIITSLLIKFLIWANNHGFLRRRYRKKLWHQTHVASSERPVFDVSKTGAQKEFHEETVLETLWRWKVLIIGLLVFAGMLIMTNTYLISFFTVDGVSMDPTLKDRSTHFMVKLPQTLANINKSEFVPTRGDIVVLHKDENNLFITEEEQAKSYVVKRVVGLPGERVVIKDGIITVYNKEFKEGFVPDERYKWIEDLVGSEEFIIDITLKDSELFVIGDNRDESIDSRFYGPVNTAEVVGKVRL